MPTKNPRINVVLEKTLYDTIKKIAKKEGISISLKARDLLKEALEIHEDIVLAELASDRKKTFNQKKSLSHEDIWKD